MDYNGKCGLLYWIVFFNTVEQKKITLRNVGNQETQSITIWWSGKQWTANIAKSICFCCLHKPINVCTGKLKSKIKLKIVLKIIILSDKCSIRTLVFNKKKKKN